jgi:predicted DNA-binding protein
MKRTTIFLPDELHEALRTRAFKERTSLAGLVREAAQQYLEMGSVRKSSKKTKAQRERG